MVRFTGKQLPWHADRPALALYDAFARDARLPDDVRAAAGERAETRSRQPSSRTPRRRAYAPFGGADYSDAVGPTVHFATTAKQRDPWAPDRSARPTPASTPSVGADRVDTALNG